MKYILFIGLLMSTVVQAACPSNQFIRAEYQATYGAKAKQIIVLWRSPTQVAYEYPEQGVTDVWSKEVNGQISLVRGFDHYKRSIEYESIDLKGQQRQSWQVIRHWVDLSNYKQRKGKQQVATEPCYATQDYVLYHAFSGLGVSWLSHWQLPQRFSAKRGNRLVDYELLKVDSLTANSMSVFGRIDDYASTDFADIGDNESDPFLAKMINMGFIEHHHNGAYNANGQVIGHQH